MTDDAENGAPIVDDEYDPLAGIPESMREEVSARRLGEKYTPSSKEKTEHDLTFRQHMFVEEYVANGGNGTKAAEKLGVLQPSLRASRWLQNPVVDKAINIRRREIAERCGISADMVMREMAMIAFARASDFFDWTGEQLTLKSKEEIEADPFLAQMFGAIAEFKIIQGKNKDDMPTVQIKMHDKQSALRDLGKVFDLFVERTEVSGVDGNPIEFKDRTTQIISRLSRISSTLSPGGDNSATESGGPILPGTQLEVLGSGRTDTTIRELVFVDDPMRAGMGEELDRK